MESTIRPISTTQRSTTLPPVRGDDTAAQVKREQKSSKQQLSFADTIDDDDKLWSNTFTGIGNMTSLLVFLFILCCFYLLIRLLDSVFTLCVLLTSASEGLKICSVHSKGHLVKIVNTDDKPDQVNGCNIQQSVNDWLVVAFEFPNGSLPMEYPLTQDRLSLLVTM